MLPKNVRQIGLIEGTRKIFMEDYVMTYARKNEGMAVLLGREENEGEEKILYISGAVEVVHPNCKYPMLLSNEDWSRIYEGVKKYFLELEILGWMLVRREIVLEIDEEIRHIHKENFKGSNKVLFLYDQAENEESFYLSNHNGDLKKQSGYYIYYEKNEAMQNYMLENAKTEPVDQENVDEAMVKVREIIAKKEPHRQEKKLMNLMYGASTILAAVVLVIGATMLDNYDKMKNMEQTLSQISSNLGEETKDESVDALDTESENKTEVETISGNVTMVPDEETTQTKIDGDENEEEQQKEEQQKEEQQKEEPVKEETKENETSKEEAEDGEIKQVEVNEQETKEEAKEEAKEVASTKYMVQAGDTLASISMKFYQSYGYMDSIQQLNAIEDSDMIYAGQVLLLPQK